jgi:hypothetical protein
MANYIGAGLLGGAGLALLGAHLRANKQNDFDDALNAHLQSQGAAPLNFGGHKNFVFKSGADNDALHYKLYEDALKQHLANKDAQEQVNDYNANGAKYGFQPFQNAKSAQNIISPYNSKDADFSVAGQYGPRAAKGSMELNNAFQPQQPQQVYSTQQTQRPKAPVNSNEPILMGNDQQPLQFSPQSQQTISTGVSQQQPVQFSSGAYITPAMVKDAQAHVIDQQNANTSSRNADTNADGLALKQQYYQNVQQPESKVKIQKLQTDINKLNTEMPWIGKKAQAYIAAQNRSGTGSGRAPNLLEVMANLKNRGEISKEDYINGVRTLSGLRPKATNANGPSKSTTYNPDGSIKSTTIREKGGQGSVNVPGQPVDVGGGASIKI